MTEKTTDLALLELLAAVAWADGRVSDEERRFLLGLAAEYGLGDEGAARIEALCQEPVSIEEFQDRLGRFVESAGGPEDLRRAVSRTERLMESDVDRHTSEIQYLHLMNEWFTEHADGVGLDRSAGEAKEGSLFGKLKGLFGRGAPGGGALGDVARGLMGKNEPETPIDEGRRAYVILFGSLLYRVVYADGVVDATEAEALRRVLGTQFGFAAVEIDYMLRSIQKRIAEDIDRQRLCAEFNRISDPAARMQVVEALFAMAQADGQVTADEEKEIRLIANCLWVEVSDFVAIRKRLLGR